MPQTEAQKRATNAVAAAMRAKGWTKADLADAAELDYGTVSDMLDFSRAIQSRTQAAIERALKWESGTYRLIALGELDAPAPAIKDSGEHPTADDESEPSSTTEWLEQRIKAAADDVERAGVELELARSSLARLLRHKAIRIANRHAFDREVERRTQAAGHTLSPLERLAVDSMERPTRTEVLEIENALRRQHGLPEEGEVRLLDD